MKMIFSDVINLVYNGSKINVMLKNGDILELDFVQLEYPYFYSSDDMLSSKKISNEVKMAVVSSVPMKLQALTDNGYVPFSFFRVEAKSPEFVGRLRRNSGYSAEGNIPYLERRLGADGIINFAEKLERYAFIDIEEQNGDITLIGEIDSMNEAVYYPFYNVNSFLDHLEAEKISCILAWNGDGYDFAEIDRRIDRRKVNANSLKRWNTILKLDAMVLYSKYTQQKLMSLNAAGKIEEVGEKLLLEDDFDSIAMEKLVEYNQRDVELMKDIIKKSAVHNIVMKIANLSGIIPNEISATRLADNLIIKEKSKEGIVLFDY
ncbi:MAG: hypothetical protein QXL94_00800, partial [Candidatus Parvarchaeum sp.]